MDFPVVANDDSPTSAHYVIESILSAYTVEKTEDAKATKPKAEKKAEEVAPKTSEGKDEVKVEKKVKKAPKKAKAASAKDMVVTEEVKE